MPDNRTLWVDRNGNRHTVEITVATAMRLKRELEIDLMACLQKPERLESLYQEFADNPCQVVAVLAEIEQADDPEGFAALFDGDALLAATDALLYAIADFFPQRQRSILLRLLTKTHELAAMQATTAEQQAHQKIDSFFTAASDSVTRGNGWNESPGLSVPAATT